MGTQPSTINRRSFITGMLATGAALSTGALVGCGGEPRNAQDSASNPSAPTSKDWTSPPSPVENGEIAETVEADIVIIGAGTSGIPAALTAVEGGRKNGSSRKRRHLLRRAKLVCGNRQPIPKRTWPHIRSERDSERSHVVCQPPR